MRKTFPLSISSSVSRFPRFKHTYSNFPSGDTASPEGISFFRFAVRASGKERLRFGVTFPSAATSNTFTVPFTLLRKMCAPSGEKINPVKLNCPDLSVRSAAFGGTGGTTLLTPATPAC